MTRRALVLAHAAMLLLQFWLFGSQAYRLGIARLELGAERAAVQALLRRAGLR